jgi:nicotinamidase-related amidase
MPGSSDLDDILQMCGIDTLIITGTATNVCCESTARDAMQMNYKVIFVADGNATNTDAEHNATLNNMVRLFANVMTTGSSSDSSNRPRPRARRPNRRCFEALAGWPAVCSRTPTGRHA